MQKCQTNAESIFVSHRTAWWKLIEFNCADVNIKLLHHFHQLVHMKHFAWSPNRQVSSPLCLVTVMKDVASKSVTALSKCFINMTGQPRWNLQIKCYHHILQPEHKLSFVAFLCRWLWSQACVVPLLIFWLNLSSTPHVYCCNLE